MAGAPNGHHVPVKLGAVRGLDAATCLQCDEAFMAEMFSPLEWAPPKPAAPIDKIGRPEFLWPTRPFASFPPPMPQTDPEPCEIVGLNDRSMSGWLTFFVPETAG
jgi:hypothetical protein